MTSEQKRERIALLLLAAKPEWCKPIDIVLACTLLMRSDSECRCYASQATLANLIGLSKVEGLRVSLDRLIDNGWVLEISRQRQSAEQHSAASTPQLAEGRHTGPCYLRGGTQDHRPLLRNGQGTA